MFDAMFPSHWSRIRKLYWLNKLKNNVATYEVVVGNPVSFTAIAAPLKQLQIAFSPVQDLHGYDSPWPAGGGKNLFDKDTVTEGYAINATGVISESNFSCYTAVIPVTAGETYTYSGVCNSAGSGSTYNNKRVHAYINGVWDSQITFATVDNGEPFAITFTVPAGVNGIRISAAKEDTDRQVEKGSSATSYAPYSNECPISGWDGVEVWLTGKNLFDQTDLSMVTCYLNTTEQIKRGKRLDLPAGTYTISAYNVTGESAYIYTDIMNADGTVKQFEYWIGGSATDKTKTFTLTQGQYFIIFDQQANNESAPNKFENFNFMLAIGSTAQPYIPYNPSSRSISISLGSTLYSGTLDVLTGVVTVTMISQDMGTLNWSYNTNAKCFTVGTAGGLSAFANGQSATEGCLAFCSSYKRLKSGTGSSFSNNDKCFSFNKNANGGGINGNVGATLLLVKDTAYDNKDTFKAAMSGVQMVYELLDPLTIQLTPQEVESLLGDNTLWSNANQPITVEYRKN